MTTFRGPLAESEPGIGALTLPGLLREVVARHGEREAIAFHDRANGILRWSYRDLDAAARRVAKALLAFGVGKGTRVGILMGNRPEWVASAFGTALAGAVVVPINTFFEPAELEYVLRASEAAILLVQDRIVSHDELASLKLICPELASAEPGALRSPAVPHLRGAVGLGLVEGVGAVEPWTRFLAGGDVISDDLLDACTDGVVPSDPATEIYTSGTTAMPKGILHAHRGPALQSWRFAQQLRWDENVRVWSAFPFFWSAGFAMVMGGTLAAGGCLVLQEHFEPGEALHLLGAEKVTAPHAWPHQNAALEEHPDWERVDLSAIRQCELISPFARHPTVHVGDTWSPRAAYGLSETFTIFSSLPSDTPPAIRERSQGAILPGNVARILERGTGLPAPAGTVGEIAVKGPTLMLGYVKLLPEECFDEDGFFRTGDAGFVDDDGYLHWTGRISDMIKTGGANVSPVEIETALLGHPDLKAALAVGVADEQRGQIVVVCAVRQDGARIDEEDVRAFLRGRIAAYKIPRRVLFFGEDELSLTGNAKIRTEELRRLASHRLGSGQLASGHG